LRDQTIARNKILTDYDPLIFLNLEEALRSAVVAATMGFFPWYLTEL
jgi:hypothetical protein